MSTLPKLKQAHDNIEIKRRADNFIALARLRALADGPVTPAMKEQLRLPDAIETLQREAIGAVTTASGVPITPETDAAATAFLAGLRSRGAYDRFLQHARRVPKLGKGLITSASATAAAVGEGRVKPMSAWQFTPTTVDEYKAVAMISVSNELFAFGEREVNAWFSTELQNAAAAEADAVALPALIAANAPIASSGSTISALRQDLRALMSAVTYGADAALFLVFHTSRVKQIANMDALGGAAFPNVGPTGGELMPGLELIASDKIASGAGLLIDATQLLASTDVVQLQSARHATLEFDTAPDSPPTAATELISLWQQGLRAVLVERLFGFKLARSTAAASISNANYDNGSP